MMGLLVAVILVGLLSFIFYRYSYRERRPHTNFRCVRHVTASGEEIGYLLSPKD